MGLKGENSFLAKEAGLGAQVNLLVPHPPCNKTNTVLLGAHRQLLLAKLRWDKRDTRRGPG